jgi:g-D-glutamyl-meso-diaminopimelate peptidase
MDGLVTLRRGSRGPQTELLQLALNRAGFAAGIDGVFGQNTYSALTRFQASRGLTADGIAGQRTWRALTNYLTGYVTYTIRPGDTLYRLASVYGTTVAAIETANPGLNPLALTVGRQITVPLGFEVVPVNISFTSTLLGFCIRGLKARYPFLRTGSAGSSVMGRPIHYIIIGSGRNEVMYNASHHANEWITSPLLMKFLENYALFYANGGRMFDTDARMLYNITTLHLIPMVNPDGVDLVAGELSSGSFYDRARSLSANYPAIPFPSGWKANINGIDTNLQYPAGWENAREIKFSQGFTRPGPRDFVGSAPLEAPESRAMYDYTRAHDFSLTLSYHTQGQVIYWKYLDYEPENSRAIAQRFGEVSGYAVEETPYGSGFAGYKDWFISTYNRPGYTVEAGAGTAPLPLTQFPEIYRDNLGILTLGLSVTA